MLQTPAIRVIAGPLTCLPLVSQFPPLTPPLPFYRLAQGATLVTPLRLCSCQVDEQTTNSVAIGSARQERFPLQTLRLQFSKYIPTETWRNVSMFVARTTRMEHLFKCKAAHITVYLVSLINSSFDCNGTPAQRWILQQELGSTLVVLAGTPYCLDSGQGASSFRHL